jgi:hypothetical protein
LAGTIAAALGAEPTMILHHGKIVTVDARFSIHEAIAVAGNRIVAVGRDEDVLKLKGPATEVVDLRGQMVLPGLMDSHTHPTGASMTEFDHPIPTMESIGDVLNYIRGRAEVVKAGEWIVLQQVFITRLRIPPAPSWTAPRPGIQSPSAPGRMRRSTVSPSSAPESIGNSRFRTAFRVESRKTGMASPPESFAVSPTTPRCRRPPANPQPTPTGSIG